jgi:hypothetical protein
MSNERKPSDKTGRDTTAPASGVLAMSEEAFALLLLRVLGSYFLGWGAVVGFSAIVGTEYVVPRAHVTGWEPLFVWEAIYLYATTACLLIFGAYFAIGGRRVVNILLSPIRRSPSDSPEA